MPRKSQQGRSPAKPGAALKALRVQRGWTLADVAERTGMTVSTLSKVENGRIALTFDKLVRLSEGLDVDITQLFGAATESPVSERAAMATRRSISRAGEGRSIEMPRGDYLYLASELLNKKIVPIYGEVRHRDIASYGDFMRHPGEEFVYVLEGALDLHIEMYTPARLEVGDSVYFDSGLAHAYIAVGSGPCRILSICTTSEHSLDASVAAQRADMLALNPPEAPAATAATSPVRRRTRPKAKSQAPAR